MKRFAFILAVFSIFGWFLHPAMAIGCRDCDTQGCVPELVASQGSCCCQGCAPTEPPPLSTCDDDCQCGGDCGQTIEPGLFIATGTNDLEYQSMALPPWAVADAVRDGFDLADQVRPPPPHPSGRLISLKNQNLRL